MSQALRQVSGGLLSVVYLIVISGCGGKDATPVEKAGNLPQSADKGVVAHANAAPEPVQTASPEPAFKVKAEDFLNEFKTDQKAADNKYKGKYVEVEGSVGESPTSLERNRMTIALPEDRVPTSGVMPWHIYCAMVPDSESKLLELGRDQRVRINGKVSMSTGGMVYLEDCSLAEVGPSPVLKTTAKALGAEFSKEDGEPAFKKYDSKDIWRPKEMFVEGVVKDVVVMDHDGPAIRVGDVVVNLDAGMGEPMVCRIDPFWREDMKKLKKGEVVVLRGTFDRNVVDAKTYPMLWHAVIVRKQETR